jgi:uncharacterized FlaG/YvyC family protein
MAGTVMDVSPINSVKAASGAATGADVLQRAVTAVRGLNNLGLSDREFAVTRDPQTHRFVVVVLDRGTGAVLDQFPPEEVLKMLSQLSSSKGSQQGNQQGDSNG